MVGILLVAAGAILLIAYFIQSSKEKNGKNNAKQASNNSKDGASSKQKTAQTVQTSRYSKNSKADIDKKDLFEFMDFEKIQDDMIVQEKGTKFTMVIQCKGINYDLMSEVEQLAVEEGFITFLNTLKSPIQLYVQARAIDLKTSLDMYKDRVSQFNKEYEDISDKYNRLASNMDTPDDTLRETKFEKEKMYNISEYAHDITRYVEKLSLNKHMLQRKFYVVLSYYKSEINSTTKFTEEELFDICYRELYTRAQGVISALQTCSVSSRVLDSNELAELIYITYNRDDQKLLDIRTALESGFYRMYTTTKDLHEKKKDLLKKQIQEEATNRLELAIKLAIDEGRIVTDEEATEAFENDVDRTAILMAEDLDMDSELRGKVENIIVKGHEQGVKERKAEREKKRAEVEAKRASKKREENITEESLNDNNEEIKEQEKEAPKEEINNKENEEKNSNNESENIVIETEETKKEGPEDSFSKDEGKVSNNENSSIEDSENDSIV